VNTPERAAAKRALEEFYGADVPDSTVDRVTVHDLDNDDDLVHPSFQGAIMIRRWVTLVGALVVLAVSPALLTHPARLEHAAYRIVERAYGRTPE